MITAITFAAIIIQIYSLLSIQETSTVVNTSPAKQSLDSPKSAKTGFKQHKDYRQIFQARQATKNYADLLEGRKQLPVYQHREMIVQKILKYNVVVVAGETGSGKSTQIPQFILEVSRNECRINLSGILTI